MTPQFDPAQDEFLVALYETHRLTWTNFWRLSQLTKLFDNIEDSVTWGSDCHASTIIWHADGTFGGEFEAIPGGVVFAEHWGENHLDPPFRVELFRFKVPQTPAEKKAQFDYLVSQVGKRYDWTGDFRFLPFLHWIPDCKDALFCSDYCFAGCAAGNRLLLNENDPKKVSPSMIRLSEVIEHLCYVITGAGLETLSLPGYRYPAPRTS